MTPGSELPVRPCVPWCEDGEEEHAKQHPDDRSCWSAFNGVGLSRSKPERYSDGEWRTGWVDVYLRREVGEEEPVVYLHHEVTDDEIVMTLAEARELQETIGRVLALAGLNAGIRH